jgi:hypothetical protein
VAASLYQKAAAITRDKRIYGTSQFNRGYALREAGYAQAAANAMSDLIKSDVNDQDPSGNITGTYQNYRNEAASLIALTYRDRGNMPMLYYWRYKTARDYPFQSWCGNVFNVSIRGRNYRSSCGRHTSRPYLFCRKFTDPSRKKLVHLVLDLPIDCTVVCMELA